MGNVQTQKKGKASFSFPRKVQQTNQKLHENKSYSEQEKKDYFTMGVSSHI